MRRDFHACPQSQNTVWKGLELTTKHNKTIHSHTQPSCSNASWTCCSNSAKPCAKLRESCNTFSQDLRKSAELMLSLSIRPPVLCKRILQRNKCPRENWQTHCRKHQCGMNCWLIRKTILQIELALGVCLFFESDHELQTFVYVQVIDSGAEEFSVFFCVFERCWWRFYFCSW